MSLTPAPPRTFFHRETSMPNHPPSIIGPVTLNVANLANSLGFYRDALGLKIHRNDGTSASLGAGGEDLLILEEHPGAARPRHSTGLFHFAILLPSRLELAKKLGHLVATRTPLQGMSDHLVSEAIYLADPEGNGIELYRDRPREDWIYDQSQLRMTTDPLDVDGLLAELDEDDDDHAYRAMPPEAVMGHVHLRVSDLPAAEAFYRDTLGFDVTTRYGNSASFLSKNGYHHHLGLNTWNSLGAPPPPPGSLGLKHFAIHDPTLTAPRTLLDPSGNQIVFSP
jgi:catechol 2,3-dioxygenase